MAFSNAWDATSPTWSRIDDPLIPALGHTGVTAAAKSHAVYSWESHRGRAYELDKTQAGTATIKLWDTTGLFDPTGSGPYSAAIGPMKRMAINVQNPHTKTYNDIFVGYVESWEWSIDTAQKLMEVTIGCVDGFEPLTRAETVPDSTGKTVYVGQQVKSRIGAALDEANWPLLLRNLNTGNVVLLSSVYDPQTQLLSVIQDAADAEFPGVANFFIDMHGNAAFRGRQPRFDPNNYPHQVDFYSVGDANAAQTFGIAPISDITWNLDNKNIYNAVLCYPYGTKQRQIASQLVTDSFSIDTYGPRFYSLPDLIIASSIINSCDGLTECLNYAAYYVNNYKDQSQRISNLVFKTVSPDGSIPSNKLWLLLTQVEIGDIIQVFMTNPGGGGFTNTHFFVEGIHNVVNPLNESYPDWTMTLDVSPRAWFTTPIG